MWPETLPKSYQDFIAKTGPIALPVYKAIRESCRGGPIDLVSLFSYLSSRMDFQSHKLDPYALVIPCSILHPDAASCLAHNANATYSTFRKTFPLYFSLTFVPFVILHLQKVIFLVSIKICKFCFCYCYRNWYCCKHPLSWAKKVTELRVWNWSLIQHGAIWHLIYPMAISFLLFLT